jgi:hypothetical protein
MNIDYRNKYIKYKNKYLNLKKNYKGGAYLLKDFPTNIYHAFNIKFRDIIPKIKYLHDNGITHIQISPIQKCRKSLGKVLMRKKKITTDSNTEWFLAYQPINYEIGNFYGSEDDLKELISECKKYNINIVIDIVINHISALLDFEYPVWNIILLLTNDIKCSLWNIYNKFMNDEMNIKDYLESVKYDLFNNYNIRRLIFEAFIENQEINIQYNEDYKKLNEKINKNMDIQKNLSDDLQEKKYYIDLINSQMNEIISYVNIHINSLLDKLQMCIKKLFDDTKIALCNYLSIPESEFREEYYNILTPPYYCSSDVDFPYICWLGQALPQLNQENRLVREKIKDFLKKLSEFGIKCLRIDAVSHIQPKIVKLYCEYFKKILNNSPDIYIYSELINVEGKQPLKYSNDDYTRLTHITDYNLLHKLTEIFCFNCDLRRLNILQLPSKDIGSVVFSATHDLIKINGANPSLSRFGEYSEFSEKEPYKIILMICYLIQRIYNVPLILNIQFDNHEIIRKCCIFRKYLADNNCIKEDSSVIDNIIFKCDKYDNNNKLLGTFYMNVSDNDKQIDDITIEQRSINIKYPYSN